MKKLMLLVPVAALAMASCSSEDVVQQKATSTAQELTIRPVVQGATRSLISDANFTGFTVEATATNGEFWEPYMENNVEGETTLQHHGASTTTITAEVTKSTSGKWELLGGKKYFWSSKNAEANFVGYNQAAGTYQVKNAVNKQKDILVAYNKGVASSFDNGVPMLFRHVMSQIVIKADNKDADVRQIKVAGVRIHNVANTNTLTLPTSETTADKFKWYSAEATDGYKPWSEPAQKEATFTYYKDEFTPTDQNSVYSGSSITLNGSAQEITFEGALLMLPQNVTATTALTTGNVNGAYIDVLVQVQNLETSVSDDADKAIFPKLDTNEQLTAQKFAWVAVPVDIAWNPGYKYTYVLHFSKDGIGKASPDKTGGDPDPGAQPGDEIVDNPVPLYFTVTIDEWQDAANTEKNL